MTNNLDQNRLDRMIAAALVTDETLLPELRRMSERMSEPADALAAFLVGDLERYLSSDERDRLPCSTEQWKFFMDRCREATKGDVRNNPLWKNPEGLARYARIGGWPNRIPHTRRDCPVEFMKLHFAAAWSWAWTQDENTPRFVRGEYTMVLHPGAIESGFILGAGLLDAIETGLIEVPAEATIRFVVAYGRWYRGAEACNADVASLCSALKIRNRLEDMPEEDLQALAGVWEDAGRELARRRVPLAVPLLQLDRDWVSFYLGTVAVPETVEEAAEAFETGDAIARYVIQRKYEYGPRVKDPADPFGPSVNEFVQLLEQKGLRLEQLRQPTYKECLAHMRQHS